MHSWKIQPNILHKVHKITVWNCEQKAEQRALDDNESKPLGLDAGPNFFNRSIPLIQNFRMKLVYERFTAMCAPRKGELSW